MDTFTCFSWNAGNLRNVELGSLTAAWMRTFTILAFYETQDALNDFGFDGYSRFSIPARTTIGGHASGGVSFFLSNAAFGGAEVKQLDSFSDWCLPLLILPQTLSSILLVGVYFPRCGSGFLTKFS